MRLWLKQIRDIAKLTHKQVADKANISRSYYTNIENGIKTPSVNTAKTLGEALDFPWERFFNNECSCKEKRQRKLG